MNSNLMPARAESYLHASSEASGVPLREGLVSGETSQESRQVAGLISGETLLLAAELVARAGKRCSLVLAGGATNVVTVACALDLGRALVELGAGRVVVVEADGEHHTIHTPVIHQSSGVAGLVDVLADIAVLDLAVTHLGNGLDLIPFSAQARPEQAAQPFAKHGVAQLLNTLKARYDCVLIAAPAHHSSALAKLVNMHTDAVALVVPRGRQTRSGLARIQAQLLTTEVKILGVILV